MAIPRAIMKALWLENQSLRIRDDVPVPTPAADETLVRVLQAGICNTDLEMIRGYYSFAGVLGHEFVGVVAEGPPDLLGRRVVGEINASCGDCAACDRDDATHCENRTVLGIKDRNGAFAEYLTLPTANLHPVPESVSTDAATFVEPLAAALEIQEQVPIASEDRVLVVGSGKIGQLIVQTLLLTGCQLHVVGRRRRDLCLPKSQSIPVGLADDIPPRSFDIVVECTGNAGGFHIAQKAVRPRGVLVMKSTYSGRLEIEASALVVNEITVVGSRCGPFAPALRLLAERLVELKPLIGARFDLQDGLQAVEKARQPEALKVLLEIGSPDTVEC